MSKWQKPMQIVAIDETEEWSLTRVLPNNILHRIGRTPIVINRFPMTASTAATWQVGDHSFVPQSQKQKSVADSSDSTTRFYPRKINKQNESQRLSVPVCYSARLLFTRLLFIEPNTIGCVLFLLHFLVQLSLATRKCDAIMLSTISSLLVLTTWFLIWQ